MGIRRNRGLTDRQKQVADLVCQGHSTESIASQLDIQRGTVNQLLTKIYQKAEVNSRTELILKMGPRDIVLRAKEVLLNAIAELEKL